MDSLARALSVLVLTFGFAAVVGGCSKIEEGIDCGRMCDRMQVCIDGDLDEHDCSERCEDRADSDAFADKLDACTDCLEDDVACSEAVDECAVCDEVQMALTL